MVKYHLEDLGLERSMILKRDLKEIGWEGVDWIYLA
jgi:hypothetical protein